jgi:hypothetical protein
MKFNPNIGSIDKVIRILISAIIGFLFYSHVIEGAVAIILLILAAVFVLTSFVGTCPLYLPFGINTKTDKKE